MQQRSRDSRLWLLALILAALLVVMLAILILLSGTIRNRYFPAPATTATSPSAVISSVVPTVTAPVTPPSPPPTNTTPPTVAPTPTQTQPPTSIPTSVQTKPVAPVPSQPGVAQPDIAESQGPGWSFLFGDDFNNGHLNVNKWVTCYWWDNQGCTNAGNNEMEWYLPGNVKFDSESLMLVAQQEAHALKATDGNTYQYSSGMVTTGRSSHNPSDPLRFSYTYGFAEIRAKVPKGQGIWPAFWMLPANNDAEPEIDVMEIIGDDPYTVNMTIHYVRPDGTVVKEGSAWKGSEDLSQDWHTYGVDWEPTYIAWYVDGVERWRYTQETNIPQEPMYLLLNLAVGGDWPGSPDSTTVFPSVFQIDYVRVWQRAKP